MTMTGNRCPVSPTDSMWTAAVRPNATTTGESPMAACARHAQPCRLHRCLYTAGFTLIEMLIVVAIILVIAGLLTPTINKMLEIAARQKAATNCQAIVMAIKEYKTLYQKWPGQTQQGPDGSIDQDLIIPALMDNPRGHVLVDVQQDWTNGFGELMDIWDQKCLIVMDENEDGDVQVVGDLEGDYPIVTNVVNAKVVVISWGPKPQIDKKRIYSWRH